MVTSWLQGEILTSTVLLSSWPVSAHGSPAPGNKKRQVIHLTASLFLLHPDDEKNIKNKNEIQTTNKILY